MSELLERLWGADDLDALFGAHSLVVAPWTRAGQNRKQQRFDRDALTALLAAPATLRDVDPRTLFANQPWIVREHVAYYRTGEWERTGRTSADQWVELNRYPVIVDDHRGRSVILAGHHRSAAALLAGRPLRVRVAAVDSRSQITPLLGFDPEVAHAAPGAVAAAVEAGVPQSVGTLDDAQAVLECLGLTPSEIRWRFSRVDAR